MSLQLSTGLRNKMLDTAPLRTILNLGFLSIYSNAGALPPTADAALVGGTHVLLCRISNNNTTTGLTLAAAAANGVITKNLAEVWSKAAVATGLAAFWRFEAVGDTGVLSTVEARLQGLCGLAGFELDAPSLNLTAGVVYPVSNWSFALPTL
jgi:hypothetical protein